MHSDMLHYLRKLCYVQTPLLPQRVSRSLKIPNAAYIQYMEPLESQKTFYAAKHKPFHTVHRAMKRPVQYQYSCVQERAKS